jgi:hypothetical protein
MSIEEQRQYSERTCYGQILQISPVTGYFAVFAYDAEEKGKYKLEADRIDALGVAEVNIFHYRREGEGWIVTREEKASNEVVGLALYGGCFEIVNSACNFAGLLREGEDIRHAIDCLEFKYLDNLTEEFRLSEQEQH